MKIYIKNLRMIPPIMILAIAVCSLLAETAHAASPDILSDISNKFYTKSESWASTLTQVAFQLFRWLLIIDVCLFGIRAVTDIAKGNSVASIVAEFAMFIFFAAFMFICIKYYKEWSNQVLDGFSALGSNLGFSKTSTSGIFHIGLDMVNTLWDAMEILSPIKSLCFLISGLIILLCFVLMAADVLIVKCESYIVMNAGIFLLGFGGMRYFKEHSINFMKFGFTVAVKLFVLQLLIGLCSSFMSDFTVSLKDPTYRELVVILGASVVMLVLVKSIPHIFSTLIMGAHGSGGASGSTVIAAAGMVGGAVAGGVASGIKAAFNTGSALAGASQVAASNARSGGPTSLGHAYGQMGATLAKAMGESAMENLRGDTGGQTFGRRTASHAARMAQEARESMRASAASPLGVPENTAIPLSGKSNKGGE